MDKPSGTKPESARIAPAAVPAHRNIYAPLFCQPPGATEPFRHPDWDRLGVEVPYIIFMTGRCGSTRLTHLLRASNLCGVPYELFNEISIPTFNRKIQARSFGDCFQGVVRQHNAGRRFGFEIDVWRFLHPQAFLDLDACFPAGRSVFFWMPRDDIVAQAYSFATAKLRGHWHVFHDAKEAAPPSAEAVPDDAAVWEEILRILARAQRMAEFAAERGLRLHRLTYEQLVTDKHIVVMRIMDLLRCPLPAVQAYLRGMDDQTARLRYDGKVAYLGEFSRRYRPLIEPVLAERTRLDLAAFRILLQASAGITA
ncbi:MAG: hypothetical protein IRZ07_08475 [Microbispora sp.]|nr:hypothetical protein [Microbispora sp.]